MLTTRRFARDLLRYSREMIAQSENLEAIYARLVVDIEIDSEFRASRSILAKTASALFVYADAEGASQLVFSVDNEITIDVKDRTIKMVVPTSFVTVDTVREIIMASGLAKNGKGNLEIVSHSGQKQSLGIEYNTTPPGGITISGFSKGVC